MANVVVIKANTNMRTANVSTQMEPDTLSMKNIRTIKINDSLEIDKTGHKLGKIFLNRLSERLSSDELKSYFIRFEKGSKSKIHLHDSEQILVGISGVGKLEIFSKIDDTSFELEESLELNEGDAVLIPPETPHWHGATEKHESSQLSFMKNGSTIWFDF
jgi:quercetin dioxygenase-like cupin family protein